MLPATPEVGAGASPGLAVGDHLHPEGDPMKSLLLAAVAAFAFTGAVFAEDKAPAAAANCLCGKPAAAAVDAVSVKVGEAEHKLAVCSKECAEAVKKMKPEEAVKAAEAHNKKAEAAK